jgi:hypothetical protein
VIHCSAGAGIARGDRLQLEAFPELGNRLDVRLLGHPILLVPTD